MEVIVKGKPKEIAALVVGLQERRREFVPEDSSGANQEGANPKSHY